MTPFLKYLIMFFVVIALGGIGTIIDYFLGTDIFKYIMIPVGLWIIYFRLRKTQIIQKR